MSTPAIPDYRPEEARARTDQVKDAFTKLYNVLMELHDRKAHRALGYVSWAEYVDAEFGMAPSRSYQLLAHGRVVAEIESAMSTAVDIPERVTRDIKDDVSAVVQAATVLVEAGQQPGKAIARAVDEFRAARRAERVEAKRLKDEHEREVQERVREHSVRPAAPTQAITPANDFDRLLAGEELSSESFPPPSVLSTVETEPYRPPPRCRERLLDTEATPEPRTKDKPVKQVDWSRLVHMLGVSREIRVQTKGLPNQDMLSVVLHTVGGGLTEEEVVLLLNRARAQQPAVTTTWAQRQVMRHGSGLS